MRWTQPTGECWNTHTRENVYSLSLSLTYTHTHTLYMVRMSLKQSVNQSHTNSQGSVVAISDGGRCSVTVDTADSHRSERERGRGVCVFDGHDGEQYCGSALNIDRLLVAVRRSGRCDSVSEYVPTHTHKCVYVLVCASMCISCIATCSLVCKCVSRCSSVE